MENNFIYIVTDGEFDGPIPGRHSMLSFASVAVTPDKGIIGEFEATLGRQDGAIQDETTMDFWATCPEAYAAATRSPEPADIVMRRFVDWIRKLPGNPIFASHPVGLDGIWFDFYLQHFTNERLCEGEWQANRLFKGAPLCLVSYISGKLGWPLDKCAVENYPPEWLGNQPHTHHAIDDARGYAHLLVHLMSMH